MIPDRNTEAFIDYKAKVEKAALKGRRIEQYSEGGWILLPVNCLMAGLDWRNADYRIAYTEEDCIKDLLALKGVARNERTVCSVLAVYLDTLEHEDLAATLREVTGS